MSQCADGIRIKFQKHWARATTWYYDTLGRQVEETLTFGAGGATRVVSRHYDEDGQSALVYPNGRRLNYTRFVDGATHTIYNDGESGTPIAEYEYIGGRTLKRAMKNGIDFEMRDGSGTHYDDLGRPLRWAHVDGSTVKIGFEYNYDQAGNRLQQRNLHDPLDSQRFAYDSSGRLVSASRGDYPSGSVSQGSSLYCDPPTTATWTGQRSAFQWMLDGAGNWDRYDTVIDSTLTSQTRTDTNFNEYATVGGINLTHNDNGDMTSDGSKQFTWDALGRLREVRTTTGTLIATYFYDADHRRVRKDLVSGNDVDILFSGWQAIEYRDSSSQAVLKQVVFGNYLDEALCLDAYSSGSIASTDYYHQNALYSVYGISDSSATLTAAYEYDPYGAHVMLTDGDDGDSAVNFNSNDTRTSNGSIGIVNLTFTGQTFDPESGLLCYKRRYYHPALGRFISRDPIKFAGRDTNLYRYARCNPHLYTDPTGLDDYDMECLNRCYDEAQRKAHSWLVVLDTWKANRMAELHDEYVGRLIDLVEGALIPTGVCGLAVRSRNPAAITTCLLTWSAGSAIAINNLLGWLNGELHEINDYYHERRDRIIEDLIADRKACREKCHIPDGDPCI